MTEHDRGAAARAPRRYDRRIAHYEDERGFALIEALAERRGVSTTALLRLLVREEAQRQGLTDGRE